MPPADPAETSGRDVLAELVERCILAFERGGDDAMQEVLAEQPALAHAAAAQIEALGASGLLTPAPPLPKRIGPYRILALLGAGGMGTVYLAEQDEPMRRRVALKVIRPGMDTREVLTRFAIERQALAMLDHPCVARALDAGTTDDGRPWLCMEYVAGLPITRYCDQRGLDVPARIELFAQVCEAVQAAHQKGILHRDLKPSNILVADRDGRPWPVIIDFGVAKSIGGRLASATLFTAHGQLVGTPEYMSPEQAANELDIDTRADVWSLGAVLYELLTGLLPIDARGLRGTTADLLRTLQETEPAAPSMRIARLGAAAAEQASRRRTEPRALRRRLRGELDWIVMKALEKDRNRRYAMAHELAADLRRHLRGEAVAAGPPSAWYRWRKFVGRHRLEVASAATVFAALVVGLATSFVFYREAEAKAAEADQSLDIALQAVERMVQTGEDRLDVVPRMEEVRRQLLEEAIGLQRQLAGQSGGARLRLRTARALTSLANAQAQLGALAAAIGNLEEAGAILAALPADQREPADVQRLQAEMAFSLGLWSEDSGRPADATAAAFADARHRIETLLARGEPDRSTRVLAVKVLMHASGRLGGSDAAAARALADRAQALADPLLADPVANTDVLPVVLAAVARRGFLLVEIGDPEGATAVAATVQAAVDRVFAATQDVVERARYLAALGELETIHYRTERYQRVVDSTTVLVDLRRRLARDFPAVGGHRQGLGVALSNRAVARQRLGDMAEAKADLEEAVEVFRVLTGERPENHTYRQRLVQTAVNLAQIIAQHAAMGTQVDWPTAERALELAERGVAAGGTGAATPLSREIVAELHRARSQVHLGRGRAEEAIAAQRDAVAAFATLAAERPDDVLFASRLVDVRENLARGLLQAGRIDEAATLVAAARELHESLRPRLGTQDHVLETRRELLELQVRCDVARGQLGDVGRQLDALVELTRDPSHDTIGRDLAAALAHAAATKDAPGSEDRARLSARCRVEVEAALSCIDNFDNVPATMLAVQRANSLRPLVLCERLAGDAAAAAAAQASIVDGYEQAWSARQNERNRRRLAAALREWHELLLASGQHKAALQAAERFAATFQAQPDELAQAAAAFATTAAVLEPRIAAIGCADRGIEVLAAAIEAGFRDAEFLRTDARLEPLRRRPGFAALDARVQ